MLQETSRKVTVRIGGETLELETGELIARKLLQVAAGGSPHALGQVSRNVNEAQRIEQARIKQDFQTGERIKTHYSRKLEAAIRAGADPIWFVPHPDDIIVDRKIGWRFRVGAPFDEADLKSIREKIAIRDALILQSVLDERLAKVAHAEIESRPAEERAGSAARILAHMVDSALLKRFRLSDEEMLWAIWRAGRRSKRELLKSAYQVWRLTGHSKPRGWTIPPWSQVGDQLVLVLRTLIDVSDECRSGALTTEAAVVSEIHRRLERGGYYQHAERFPNPA